MRLFKSLIKRIGFLVGGKDLVELRLSGGNDAFWENLGAVIWKGRRGLLGESVWLACGAKTLKNY